MSYEKPEDMTGQEYYYNTCHGCGGKDLEKFAAGGLVQARCRDCRRTQSIGPHMPGEVTEQVYVPSDGTLPYPRYIHKSGYAPAHTKKLEFE